MKVTFADKSIAWLTLLSGLSISAVAVYYSVAGLISIFSAAVIPIAVMGITLELSKLVGTVWLKQNWFIAPRFVRYYLLSAIAILMVITSMGIFGFLSKAHSDQALISGDVQAKLSIIDEKIKIERENISNAQSLIKQMDAAVTGVIATGDQEFKRKDGSTGVRSAAERSLQIRRSQAKDRASLTKQIEEAQATIVKLQEEAAPIRAENRKVEAEVGPIKYIAALIYGDNPDTNLLEKAVRWVIMVIVVVFDPLAVILLLASQYSFQWFRKQEEEEHTPVYTYETFEKPTPDEINAIEEVEEKIENAATDDIHNNADNHSERNDTRDGGSDTDVDKDHEFVDDVTDDETESTKTKAAKAKWKSENPHDTLKHQEWLYQKGLIDNLPWEQVEAIEEKKLEEETPPSTGKNILLSDIMDPRTFEISPENFEGSKKKSTFITKEENQQVKKTKE